MGDLDKTYTCKNCKVVFDPTEPYAGGIFGNSTRNLRSLIHVTMGLQAVEKLGAFLKGE